MVMVTPEQSRESYDRGHAAGGIDARLAGHDQHFESINGSLGRIADEMHGLKLAVQRLADQAVARDATVVTTAAALKDAEDARRDKIVQRWTPFQRAIAVVVAACAVAGVLVAIYLKK